MKQFSKDLGNVSLAPKGKWSRKQEYERLNLVYNSYDNLSYVAKINVPSKIDIDNREYWQPLNVSGYADNNFINLTTENENGTITAFDNIEEAVATILPINRRAGATLSFYNLNSDRLDRQAEFELWQFNSTDLANWENRTYWNNVYYNWNVFVGWYIGADALKNHVKLPTVGQYAYVGSNLNDAILYQCRTNGTWTNTGTKVRNYISVVVSGNITIGDNGNWFSDGKDTGIPATPAVDEKLDNIGLQLQQHVIEIMKLQKNDELLKSNINSNFEIINNKVDEIKIATDNNIDTVDKKLQKQITDNDNDIANLNTKHESLSKTVQGIAVTGGASTATNVTYDKTNSGLNAENAQDAIDKLANSENIKYNNETSGLEVGNVQEAIDEVGSKVSDLNANKSGSFGWEYGYINPSTNAIVYGDRTRLINNVPLPKIGSIKLKEGYLVASCFELTALGNLSNYTSVNNISHSWNTKYGVVLTVKKANGSEEFEGTTGFLETLVDDSNKEINAEFKSLDDKFKSLSKNKSGSFGWEYGFVNVSNNTIVYGDRTRLINNVPLPKVGSIELEEGFLIASYYELSVAGNLCNHATVNASTYSWNTKYGVVLVIKKTNGDEEIEQPYGFIKTLNDNSETDNSDRKFETYNTIGSPELYNQTSLEDTKDFRLYDTISSWYEAWDNLAIQYSDWLKREDDIGKDESGKYEMRHYTLRMQHPMVTADRQGNGENKWDDSLYKYRHILINIGMHTDEKYAMLGSFLAIKNLLESNENWARFIKNNFVLDIIPCACPWGLENNYNGEYGLNVNGVNINRDFANKSAAETRNIIGLVEKLLPLGLVGIIDTHNTGLGDGYFVCKKTYTHYNYYCLLTQMVNANLYHLFAQVFTNGRKSHFHTWNYESEASSIGQFHWYADQIGVLGCTMEIAIAAGFKGSLLTKSVLLNLITSFGTYGT